MNDPVNLALQNPPAKAAENDPRDDAKTEQTREDSAPVDDSQDAAAASDEVTASEQSGEQLASDVECDPAETSVQEAPLAPLTIGAAAAPLTIAALNQMLLRVDPTLAARGLVPGVKPSRQVDPPDATDRGAQFQSEPSAPRTDDRSSGTELDRGLKTPSDAPGSSQAANLQPQPARSIDAERGLAAASARTGDDVGAGTLATSLTEQTSTALPVEPRSTPGAPSPLERLTSSKPTGVLRAVDTTGAQHQPGTGSGRGEGGGGGGGASAHRAAESSPLQAATAGEAQEQATLQAQIARGTAALFEKGEGAHTVTLRLHPQTLGAVRINLQVDGETVKLRFAAEQAEARELLTQTLPGLKDLLEERGLLMGEFSATVDRFEDQTGQSVAERREGEGGQPPGAWNAGSQSHQHERGEGPPQESAGRSAGEGTTTLHETQRQNEGPAIKYRADGVVLRLDAVA